MDKAKTPEEIFKRLIVLRNKVYGLNKTDDEISLYLFNNGDLKLYVAVEVWKKMEQCFYFKVLEAMADRAGIIFGVNKLTHFSSYLRIELAKKDE